MLASGELLGLPVWGQVALAVIALLTAAVGLVKQRDANVWRHIGAMQKQLEDQAKQIDVLQAHVARLDDENENLKREVDTHRVARNMPPKYFAA